MAVGRRCLLICTISFNCHNKMKLNGEIWNILSIVDYYYYYNAAVVSERMLSPKDNKYNNNNNVSSASKSLLLEIGILHHLNNWFPYEWHILNRLPIKWDGNCFLFDGTIIHFCWHPPLLAHICFFDEIGLIAVFYMCVSYIIETVIILSEYHLCQTL